MNIFKRSKIIINNDDELYQAKNELQKIILGRHIRKKRGVNNFMEDAISFVEKQLIKAVKDYEDKKKKDE